MLGFGTCWNTQSAKLSHKGLQEGYYQCENGFLGNGLVIFRLS